MIKQNTSLPLNGCPNPSPTLESFSRYIRCDHTCLLLCHVRCLSTSFKSYFLKESVWSRSLANFFITEEQTEGLSDSEPVSPDPEGASSAIGFIGAFKIPGVVEFSMCLFFAKLVSYTFLYWLPNYIHSKSGVNAEEAAVLSTIFDWGKFRMHFLILYFI